jgi:hypothetical protein
MYPANTEGEKMKRFIWFLVIFLFFFCTRNQEVTGVLTETETGELAGHLVFGDGSMAQGANVEISPADTSQGLPKTSSASQLESIQTDEEGRYSFTDLEDGTYNISASYIDNQDTLVAYRFNIVFVTTLYLGIDTLISQGKARTQVLLDGQMVQGVDCYIPGTSYIAVTDDSGFCVISGILPGTYDISYRMDNYITETQTGVEVVSDETAEVGVVQLEFDPSRLPPEPSGLSAVYDPDSGVVYLTWNPVNVSDIAGYIIYRDDTTSTEPTRLTLGYLITDTIYRDTIYTDLQDTATVAYHYRIKAQDQSSNKSGYVLFETVIVTPPNKPALPAPVNNTADVILSPTLSWLGVTVKAGKTVFYDVYLSTDSSFENPLSSQQSGTTLDLSNLLEHQTYYWQVIAVVDGQENPGPIWSFTTRPAPDTNNAPIVPHDPWPADNTFDQSVVNLLLSWTGGDLDSNDVVLYDVTILCTTGR